MNSKSFRMSKCMTTPNMLGSKKKAKKSLLCAVMAGVVACGGAASAATLDEVDLTQIPLDKPTLDYLHENNVTMPPELDGEGNVVDGTDNIIFPESGYTLTEVKNADPENQPDNTITKYELTDVTKYYHPETGAEVAADALETGVEYKQVTVPQANPKYYTVGLKQTEYGTKDGATDVKYFNWGLNTDGQTVLTEGTSVLKANDITYYINASASELATQRITGNQNGADINKTFINFESSNSGVAIYNTSDSKMGNIIGDFISNFYNAPDNPYGSPSDAYGGAIYNYVTKSDSVAEIGDITGNFIGNYVKSSSKYYWSYTGGGAIANYANNSNSTAKIGDIKGSFIGNRAYIPNLTQWESTSYGGAIYNYANSGKAVIENIQGTFIANFADDGGAIYNGNYGSSVATVGNISGDFIGNYAKTNGGAIYNSGTIKDITGDFIGNYATTSGGVIYNQNGTIGDITGDFVGNYAKSPNGAYGGAIFNQNSTINKITSNFVCNYTTTSSPVYASYGGAISNSNKSIIKEINGDFINNYVLGSEQAFGGAIYNTEGTIGNIIGDFSGNYVQGSADALGGAIYNFEGTIGAITGDFIGNYVQSSTNTQGGAVSNNEGTIGNITGDFVSNYVQGFATAYGGAIYNRNYDYCYGSIGDISGKFIGNYVQSSVNAYGGAIYNYNGSIGQKNADGNIIGGIINSSFINNYAKSESGEAQGGAIWTNQDLNIIAKDGYTSVYSGNYTESNGIKDPNAIYVDRTTLNFDMQNGGSFVIKDNIRTNRVTPESFYADNGVTNLNDYAKARGFKDSNIDTLLSMRGYTSLDELAKGWGYENGEDMLSREGYSSFEEMAENYGYIKGTPEEQFLYTQGNITEEEFLKSQGVRDSIVNIKGDDINNTTFYLFNDIHDANVTFANTTINTINNDVHTYNFNKLTLNADTNFVADVDLKAQTMDRFTADSYGQHAGNLNVVGMNLLTDAPEDREVTEIYFAQQGLKDNVAYGGAELPHDNYQTTFYTPIYKYNAIYDNRDDAGYFMFTKGDKIISGGGTSTPIITPSGNPSDAFNPAVLGSPVAAQTGAMATVGQAFNYAFQNSDNFMTIPYLERVAMKNANRYALSPTGDATDVGTFSPLFTQQDHSSVWVKPYATFENVQLKNGPKVSNITYGTLIGFDGEMQHLKRGWDRVWTGYIGYNGASQRYSGVDSIQNGGLVGATMTMYKGHFFNATTLSVGASLAENTNMYGKEDFTMLLGGIANKSGYNFEYKEGKIILQPSMLVSYTFVNTFDYNNAAGVRIDTKPLHAIQLAPGVKLIGNLKDGWQPYASVNMVWNLMGKSDVTANGVKLPEMSLKPYVQYGVGVQKRIKDRAMAYGQAMIQNGGRNGISLSGGFRWALGKEGKPIEKVSCPQKKCASAKKLVPVFVMGNGEKIKVSTKTLTPPLSLNKGEGGNKILRSAQNDNLANGSDAKTFTPDKQERKVLKQMTQTQKSRLMAKTTAKTVMGSGQPKLSSKTTTRTSTIGVIK